MGKAFSYGSAIDISYRVRTTRTQGRLGADDVLALAQAHPAATLFLCGSAGYMVTMITHLAAAGVAPDRIRQEHFRVAGEQPAPEAQARQPQTLP